MTPCCKCVTILREFVPVKEVATLISQYIPHRTDIEVIQDRLRLGQKWTVKANDDFVNWERAHNIKRQEVIFKIEIQDLWFDLEETCHRYHSHGKYSIFDKAIPL
jgi:hypothetical protein